MRKFLPLLVLALLTASPAFAACEDDPRLGELPALLAAGTMPEKPFYLTPQTFFRLQPAVRAQLGDSIVICPRNPVTGGAPALPPVLRLDFPDLWDVVEEAAFMDDWENVRYLRDHAAAKPLDPAAVFSLLVIPLFDQKSLAKLDEALSLFLVQGSRNSSSPKPVFLADIFAALGGKAQRKATVVWSSSPTELAEARSKAEARGEQGLLFLPYSGYALERAANAMEKFQIGMVEARNYIRR